MNTPAHAPRFSRRGLLAAGGGVAAAAALGGGFLATQVANADTTAAAVPVSGKFDLTAPSTRLFWKKPLKSKTVMQCFAFDSVNKRVYIMQRANGTDPTEGHLTLTQLDLDGNIKGYMQLKGFGHGIAFGVQPTDDGPVLWTEADSVKEGDSARATKLCRFPFKNEATITKDDVELIVPLKGMRSASCSLDLDHNTIAVRCVSDGSDKMRITLFDFEKFAAGEYTPLAAINAGASYPKGVTPQGYQHYGQHVYMFEGNAYYHEEGKEQDNCDVSHPDGELDGNAYVSRVNFNDESDIERHLTKAGYSLSFREPEGLGLLKVGDELRLCMGFASGCGGDRRGNIYYKNVFG